MPRLRGLLYFQAQTPRIEEAAGLSRATLNRWREAQPASPRPRVSTDAATSHTALGEINVRDFPNRRLLPSVHTDLSGRRTAPFAAVDASDSKPPSTSQQPGTNPGQ